MPELLPALSTVLSTRFELLHPLKDGDLQRPVWRARDRVLEVDCVIKGLWHAPQARVHQHIINEYQRLKDYQHPNLPDVYALGLSDSTTDKRFQLSYFIQEYIPGPNLMQLKGQLDSASLILCLKQLLEVCEFFHKYNLTNLDLKSEHLILSNNSWYLIDLDQANQTHLLSSHQLSGTIGYLAPERIQGDSSSVRSDLYSVGAIAFEALTGTLFRNPTGEDHHEELTRKLNRWETQSHWQPVLALIHACLNPEPSGRPASALIANRLLGFGPKHATERVKEPAYQTKEYLIKTYDTLRSQWAEAKGLTIRVAGSRQSGRTRFIHELLQLHMQVGHPALFIDIQEDDSGLEWSKRVQIFLHAHATDINTPFAPMASTNHRLSALAGHLRNDLLIAIACDRLRNLQEYLQELAVGSEELGICVLICEDPHATRTTPSHGEPLYPPRANLQMVESLMFDLWPRSPAVNLFLPELIADCDQQFGTIYNALALQFLSPSKSERFWQEDQSQDQNAFLTGLPESQKLFLQVILLLGKHTNLSLVYGVMSCVKSDLVEPQILAQSLIQRGILSTQNQYGSRYLKISLPNLKNQLRRTMGNSQRREIHLHIGQQMVRNRFNAHKLSNYDIAWHFFHSTEPALSLQYLAMAKAEATREDNPTSELNITTMLLPLQLEGAPAAIELQIRKGELLFRLDRLTESEETFRAILEEDGPLGSEQAIQCAMHVCDLLNLRGKPREAERFLESALDKVDPQSFNKDLRVKCVHSLAYSNLMLRELDKATERFESVESIISSCSHETQIAHTIKKLELAMNHGNPQNFDPKQIAILSALQPDSLSTQLYAQCRSWLAGYYHYRQEYAQALTILNEGIQWVRSRFLLSRESGFLCNRSIVFLFIGKQEEALKDLSRAIGLARRLGDAGRELAALKRACRILLNSRSNMAQVLHYYERIGHILEDYTEKDFQITYRIFGVEIDLRLNQLDGLEERLDVLYSEALEARFWNEVLLTTTLRAQLALQVGESHRAWDYIAEFHPYAKNVHNLPNLYQFHHTAMQIHQGLVDKYRGEGEVQTDQENNGGSVLNLAAPSIVMRSGDAVTPQQASEVRLQDLQRWRTVLNTLIQSTYDEKVLAANLAKTVGEILDGRGLVLLFRGRKTQVIQTHNMNDFDMHEISSNVVKWVRQSAEPLHRRNVHLDSELNGFRSIRQGQVRSLICWPILIKRKVLGVIYVDTKKSTHTDPQWAEALVHMVADLAAQLLQSIPQSGGNTRDDIHIPGLLGISDVMVELRKQIQLLSQHPDPQYSVLILGKPGTGKSEIARILHEMSPRHSRPFVTVNTPALSTGTGESELFGHAKGAFTGAIQARAGCFERAAQGTVFFDEVGDMGMEAQKTLLIALGQRRYNPLGDETERQLTSALIWATNRDIDGLIEDGRMRADFADRIWVNTLRVPSLRERGPDDITILLAASIQAVKAGQGLDLKAFNPDLATAKALVFKHFHRSSSQFLMQYHWPGNIRQLLNLFRNAQITQAIINELPIELHTIRLILARATTTQDSDIVLGLALPAPGLTWQELTQHIEELKTHYITRAYLLSERNQSKTAQDMNTTRPTIKKFINPTLVDSMAQGHDAE